MGSKARAEKVRTYNFKDDRVTDHRLKISMGNLAQFLKGGEDLDRMVSLLSELHLTEQLTDIIETNADTAVQTEELPSARKTSRS